MARPQSPILSINDDSNYWYVIQWISRRFDEEALNLSRYVSTEPVGRAIDANQPTEDTHQKVTASWRELQKLWTTGWEADYNNRQLPNADAYFNDLVERTNIWIDEHFPANDLGPGRERKRLLAAVRQQRLREKRSGSTARSAIQVSVAGDLYKQLYRHWDIPETKRHDIVRAALEIILESPDLLIKAKQKAGVIF